jgi:hypothetical protein
VLTRDGDISLAFTLGRRSRRGLPVVGPLVRAASAAFVQVNVGGKLPEPEVDIDFMGVVEMLARAIVPPSGPEKE